MEGRNVSLDGEWKIRRAAEVEAGGERLSRREHRLDGWIPATVPGTVLGALIGAGRAAEPWDSSGAAEPAPDASAGGPDAYTYWWVRDFDLDQRSSGERYWLDFHGVNYRADVFVNGKPVAEDLTGMFRRHSVEITGEARPGGGNRVAVRVRPPWPPGTPEEGRAGGAGGPGNVASSVTMRYTAGWDWIPAVPDRNTGLWDHVELRVTGPIRFNDSRVVTYVLGPDGTPTDKATVMIGAEVHNAGGEEELGTLTAHLVDTGQVVERDLRLQPGERTQAALPDVDVMFPHLWWPRGADGADGEAPALYTVELLLNVNGVVSDRAVVRFGIREVASRVDEATGSRVFQVNGRDVFAHAADWIGTDALLRARHRTRRRHLDEVRLLADAGLNLLRVWGGGVVEGPDFYAACDELGVMVVQDFPRSVEYTGPYPDEHESEFMAAARDSIKRLRNHPSLVLWSGGNEVPEDDLESWQESVDHCLRCHVTGRDRDGDSCRFTGASPCDREGVLDGTRPYVASSRSAFQGMARVELPRVEATPRQQVLGEEGLGDAVAAAMAAQAAVEAARGRAWHPHGGLHLGFVQGPWPGMPGTLYDRELQTGGAFFGVRRALRPLQVVLTAPEEGGDAVRLVNAGPDAVAGTLRATAHDADGKRVASFEAPLAAEPGGASAAVPLEWRPQPPSDAIFSFELVEGDGHGDGEGEDGEAEGAEPRVLAANRRWRSTSGDGRELETLPWVELEVAATVERVGEEHRLTARLRNPEGQAPAFAVQLLLLRGEAAAGDEDGEGGGPPPDDPRALPAFYSDNYFTLLPGEERSVTVTCRAEGDDAPEPVLEVGGWNVDGTRPLGD